MAQEWRREILFFFFFLVISPNTQPGLGTANLVSLALLQICTQRNSGSHYNAVSVSVALGLARDSASLTSSQWCSCWRLRNHTLSKKSLNYFPTFVLQARKWENESVCPDHIDLQGSMRTQIQLLQVPVPCSSAMLHWLQERAVCPWDLWVLMRTGEYEAILAHSCFMMEPLNSLWSHSSPIFNLSLHHIANQWCAGKCLTTGFLGREGV